MPLPSAVLSSTKWNLLHISTGNTHEGGGGDAPDILPLVQVIRHLHEMRTCHFAYTQCEKRWIRTFIEHVPREDIRSGTIDFLKACKSLPCCDEGAGCVDSQTVLEGFGGDVKRFFGFGVLVRVGRLDVSVCKGLERQSLDVPLYITTLGSPHVFRTFSNRSDTEAGLPKSH